MKIIILFISLCGILANAQSVTIDPKANSTPIFEIKSTTEGLVMPKLTVAQRNVMAGLTAGTQVYCTDCTPFGPYSYDGGSWVAMFQTQTVSPITYTVGQAAQGGIVFWIDPASGGQHGLVAATYNDIGFYIPWSSVTVTYYGAGSLGFYGGEKNTAIMLANINNNNAARFAIAFIDNNSNYGDWYLPSFKELLEMYAKRALIGNFTPELYWSSTEHYTGNALGIDFSVAPNPLYYSNSRVTSTYGRIRTIRRF